MASREIPPWTNSSMDGYAVRSSDTAAGGGRLTVVGRVTAGAMPERSVGPGEAMRIFTGAPLPPGADAVIPQEDVVVDDSTIRLARVVEPLAFVRPQGEDVRPGEHVLAPGQRIGPAEIGLLATLGRPQVLVHR